MVTKETKNLSRINKIKQFKLFWTAILTIAYPDIQTPDTPLKLLQKALLLSIDGQRYPVVILRPNVVPKYLGALKGDQEGYPNY